MEIKSVTCRAKIKNWEELDTIVSRAIELEEKMDELKNKMDSDNFCADCPYAHMTHDTVEYWGSYVNRDYTYCDAEFNPEYSDCARHDEYQELEDEFNQCCDEFEALMARAIAITPAGKINKDSDGKWDYDCSLWVFGDFVARVDNRSGIIDANSRFIEIDRDTVSKGIIIDTNKSIFDGDYIRMVVRGKYGKKIYHVGTVVYDALGGFAIENAIGDKVYIANFIDDVEEFSIVGNKYDGYYYKNAYIPESKEELIELIKNKVPFGVINTSKITDMSNLFVNSIIDDCTGIETWDTSRVTDMSYMFYHANIKSPAIAGIAMWNTGNVKNMYGMFACSNFDYDISKWDTSNVSNMSKMFYGSPFNCDLSRWNIKSLTDGKLMFDEKYNYFLTEWFSDGEIKSPVIANALNDYFGANIVKYCHDTKGE